MGEWAGGREGERAGGQTKTGWRAGRLRVEHLSSATVMPPATQASERVGEWAGGRAGERAGGQTKTGWRAGRLRVEHLSSATVMLPNTSEN